MTTRRRTSAAEQARLGRAMLAGCDAVTGQFFPLRAEIVAELAKCPVDGTDAERRAGLITALERTNREIEIMRHITANIIPP